MRGAVDGIVETHVLVRRLLLRKRLVRAGPAEFMQNSVHHPKVRLRAMLRRARYRQPLQRQA